MTGTQCAHAFCIECLLYVYSTHGDSSRFPLCRALLNLFPDDTAPDDPAHQPLFVAPIHASGDQDIYTSTSEEADDRDSDTTDD
jgi:hypothetical protein